MTLISPDQRLTGVQVSCTIELMHALKTDPAKVVSLRHRPVRSLPQDERPTALFDDDDRDASAIIALLADALERIRETTTDDASREIAGEAMLLFQGR